MRASLASEAAEPIVAAGSAEADVWRQHAASIWQGAGAIVRVSWLPAELPVVLDLLDASGSTGAVEMIGRVGTGAGLVRIEGDSRRQIAAIERLRASRALGSVVIVRASRAVKETIDVWGPRPNMALLESIKRTLDPALVLGAGRGPL
jgi:hypothetical protein